MLQTRAEILYQQRRSYSPSGLGASPGGMSLTRWHAINAVSRPEKTFTKVEGHRRHVHGTSVLSEGCQCKSLGIHLQYHQTLKPNSIIACFKIHNLLTRVRSQCTETLVSCERKKKRLQFGRRYWNWAAEQWRNVISDESKFIIEFEVKGPRAWQLKHETSTDVSNLQLQL